MNPRFYSCRKIHLAADDSFADLYNQFDKNPAPVNSPATAVNALCPYCNNNMFYSSEYIYRGLNKEMQDMLGCGKCRWHLSYAVNTSYALDLYSCVTLGVPVYISDVRDKFNTLTQLLNQTLLRAQITKSQNARQIL